MSILTKTISEAWQWLDGNKTLFGLAILYFADKPGDLLGSALLESMAHYIGSGLITIGVGHKFKKGINNT